MYKHKLLFLMWLIVINLVAALVFLLVFLSNIKLKDLKLKD